MSCLLLVSQRTMISNTAFLHSGVEHDHNYHVGYRLAAASNVECEHSDTAVISVAL
jgi:hypothetical protein